MYVFDAYGTLLDVDGAAREAAQDDALLAKNWQALSADWRRKQLEYSWLRAITGDHTDFWRVTRDALDWCAERHGIDAVRCERLMQLYRALPAYPEAADALRRLRAAGHETAILSNGEPAMLTDGVRAAGLEPHLDAVLSVETGGRFKPSDEAYRVATDHFACAPGEITFISSNGWDVYGATRFGFVTAWVNRGRLPVDRLPARPDRIITSLDQLLD